jgi:hypothetical protein
MPSKVFISYRRDDGKYRARMIHAASCQAAPRDHLFMDIDSIPPGANFRKLAGPIIAKCYFAIPDGSLRVPSESRIEIGEALARDIPVLPVLTDGTPMPSPRIARRPSGRGVAGGRTEPEVCSYGLRVLALEHAPGRHAADAKREPPHRVQQLTSAIAAGDLPRAASGLAGGTRRGIGRPPMRWRTDRRCADRCRDAS